MPLVAGGRIFHDTQSDLTRTRNLHYKRGRRTQKLKLSTLHEINSLKISKHAIHETIFMLAMSVLVLPVARTTGSLRERKKLALDKPAQASTHDHKQIRINKDVQPRKNKN